MATTVISKSFKCPKQKLRVLTLCFVETWKRDFRYYVQRCSLVALHNDTLKKMPSFSAFSRLSGPSLGLVHQWQLPRSGNAKRGWRRNPFLSWQFATDPVVESCPSPWINQVHERKMKGFLQHVTPAHLHRYLFNAGQQYGGVKGANMNSTFCGEALNFDSAERFRQTTRRIIETKEKMKERMEQIIQRENIFTIPNLLCVTRIGLSPVLGYLVLHDSYHYALGIFAFAGLTDLLDGMIARHFPSQQSMLGSFLDPMADKLLVGLLFISLTAAEMIPVPLTVLIVGRDMCLLGAGFYIRYLSLPPPRTFSRYFDVTHATARLSPTFISKINTSVQLLLVGCTLAAPVFHLVDHPMLHFLWYITAWTTMSSGLSYMFSSDTFQLLRKTRQNLNQNVIFRNDKTQVK